VVVLVVTCVAAFVRTESREGMIALLVAFVLAIVFAGPHRPRILAVILITAALGVTYYAKLAPASTRLRVTSLSGQDSAGRTDLWRLAMRVGSDHPIKGAGLNFPVASPRYADSTASLTGRGNAPRVVVHNTYLETFSEPGLVGLAP
jgi:O-antigen ligase